MIGKLVPGMPEEMHRAALRPHQAEADIDQQVGGSIGADVDQRALAASEMEIGRAHV